MGIQNATELLESADLAKSAVLVVDVQNDWCHKNGAYAKAGNDTSSLQIIVPKIKDFVQKARGYDVPIIHIGTTHSKWTNSPSWQARFRNLFNINADALLSPGSWGADFYKITPQIDDYVVLKHRYSAFVDTDLDLVLRSIGASTLIMCGFATNACVQYTAVHGYMKDYYVAVLEDCTATFTAEEHKIALSHMKKFGLLISTSETIIKTLEVVRQNPA